MVIVKRKELSLLERLYLPEILRGLSVTMRAMFRPKITRKYPEERLVTDEVTRGQPRLVVNEDDTIRCVSCGLCEAACPAYAITIDGQETDRFIEREPERTGMSIATTGRHLRSRGRARVIPRHLRHVPRSQSPPFRTGVRLLRCCCC